jgi:hypothetical protein
MGCQQQVQKIEPTKEEKAVYVQSLKEKILKAETEMIRLKFEKERLNTRFSKISKIEFTQKVLRLEQQIDELLEEIQYLRSLNLDELYDYP